METRLAEYEVTAAALRAGGSRGLALSALDGSGGNVQPAVMACRDLCDAEGRRAARWITRVAGGAAWVDPVAVARLVR